MTDSRPVLIGMNNPLSRRPEHALYPEPPGCTGNRIYNMLREHVPALTQSEYLSAFDRRNLVVGQDWSPKEGRRGAYSLAPLLRHRRVVLLGTGVRDAMIAGNRAETAKPLVWIPHDWFDSWALVPHPSGRNRWYNDPTNRSAAGAFLALLLPGLRG